MFKEYCTGCGLCASVSNAQMERNDKGFRCISKEEEHIDFCRRVCPAGGMQCSSLEKDVIWGRQQGVFLSYSTDEYIRHMASSGGVLTGLALYLVESHKVDGIIHIKQDEQEPIETEVVCSISREEVLRCIGSRYSASMPLGTISRFIGDGKKYAFIGKPCDVTAFRNYLNTNHAVASQFPYLLSFFCAGAPSKVANVNLLNKLGCTEETYKLLRYRGNGWPGYATAVDKEGKEHCITYREAWRDTLGRDVRKICRFCLDGIGELADISCGDAWYLDENKKPKFDEAEGRNVVFCRTDSGRKLFEEAVAAGYVSKIEYPDYEEELPYYQAYQYERRATMESVLLAMKLMRKNVPKYNKKLLRSYSKKISFRKKISRFKGIVKRTLQGKL